MLTRVDLRGSDGSNLTYLRHTRTPHELSA